MRDAINKAIKLDVPPHSTSPPPPKQQLDSDAAGHEAAASFYPFDELSRASLSSITRAVLSPSLVFLRWLTQFLIDCQYPAAAYERHCAALEMLRLMVACFNLQHERQQQRHETDGSGLANARTELPSALLESHLVRHAVLAPLLTAPSVLVLLAGVGRAWQSVRSLSYSILVSAFPCPLPGFSSFSSVRRLLEWSLSLSSSPRARDSEAGALAIKLVFVKYVKQLAWIVPLQQIALSLQQRQPYDARSSAAAVSPADDGVPAEWSISSSSTSAVFSFLCSIRSLLVSQLAVLRSAPLSSRYTAAHARLHGVVRLFRLVVEDVDYSEWNNSDERRREWTALVSDMLAVLGETAIVSLKLHVPKQAHRVMQAAIRAEKASIPADITATLADTMHQMNGLQAHDGLLQSSFDSGEAEGSEDEHEDDENEDGGEAEGDEADADVASVDCRGHVVLAGSELDGSSVHLIVVSSWLAIKEVCLLLGAWVKTCPLSLSEAEAESGTEKGGGGAAGSRGSLLSVNDVQRIGGVFLSVLGHSKHNGVLENAHAGLLQVCERLLSSDEVAYRIVCGWLDELMRRVSAADDDSWLRRSRGIAFALLAILKAQPTHRPPVLLSQAMEGVLKQASKAVSHSSGSEWRAVVHGLNLLRSLFRDSSLHVSCLPYVTAALEASVGGFSHPVWAVRNSALISFAPIAFKAIRAQYNQQLKQQSGMTAAELFSLYPNLRPFLLHQLTQASATSDAATTIHPTLYPLLMLLSRLRAAHNAAGADTEPFIAALHSLASHPHQQARRIAARALVALTAMEQRQTVMADVAQQLPDSEKAQQHGHTGWNMIDGLLLQLIALFEAWQSQRGSSSDGWLESFVGQLYNRDWLGSTAVPIPAIRISFLSLLTSAVLSLPRQHSFRSLLGLHKCLTSLTICCEPSATTSFVGVGSAAMRSQAASLLVRLLLSATETVDATSVSLSLLADRDMAVRLAVMQTVLFVLPVKALAARLDCAAIHSFLCASLAGLSHPATLTVALRLLAALDERLSAEADVAYVSSLVDPSLWSLLMATAMSDNAEVQAAALPCLGRSVRAAIGAYLLSPTPAAAALQPLLTRCTAWLVCLAECCDDLRVPAVRHAAWLSINQSGCIQSAAQQLSPRQPHFQLSLHPAIAVCQSQPSVLSWPTGLWSVCSLSGVSLWLWQLVLRLMCDESAAIRDDAAALAYVSLPSSQHSAEAAASAQRSHQPLPAPLPSLLSASTRARLPAVSIASAVVERSFAFIASAFRSEQAIAFMLQLFAAQSSDGQHDDNSTSSTAYVTSARTPACCCVMALAHLCTVGCALLCWAVMAVFCYLADPAQLFDLPAVAALLSAPSTAGQQLSSAAAADSQALFAAEKANHVLEAAHLLEMSAYGQSHRQHQSQPTRLAPALRIR